MKRANENSVRAQYVEKIMSLLADEEVIQTGTGSIAFPVVADDGEEGWVELVVKIPRWTDDDDGYSKSEEYKMNLAEKEEKAKEKEKAKKEKIAKDKAKREKKKEEKDE